MCAEGACVAGPMTNGPHHGRRLRLHRVSEDPQPARRRSGRAGARSARTVPVAQHTCAATRWRSRVSGQSGLARFIKLPPVESKKIPDIVKYEARQQIPFALEDVVWDYQQMAGGSEEDGFALETEVGLFAMKRDQVYRALKPFEDAGIEVDIMQLTPLAIYNYHGLRPDAGPAAGRSNTIRTIRRNRWWCSRWAPTRPTW